MGIAIEVSGEVIGNENWQQDGLECWGPCRSGPKGP